MKLSAYAQGHDNNFNLIRFIAAISVLFSHSFPLATGTGSTEPFRVQLNMTIGSIAVDIFFLTSGFLVTSSLLLRREAISFLCARALRIFPGLWAMLLLSVVLYGSIATKLPLATYLTSPAVFQYLMKCSTLVTGVSYSIPGVFEDNPFGSVFNGSLWTLPFELGMYGILLTTWVSINLLDGWLKLFRIAIASFSLLSGLYLLLGYFHHGLPSVFELHDTYKLPSLFYMFFSGGAFFVLRNRISLKASLFWTCFLALIASTQNRHAFFMVYLLTLPYLLFYIAYVPGGKIRVFNRLGDYSYGVYIYAFPVEQALVSSFDGISSLALGLMSAPITLLLAALSWHLVEKRSLEAKTWLSRRLHSILK
ncbi:acyltransferase [Ferrovum sp.]|uniref:acyltransferase family protein n=1 Tax=Ferrovum sp. TaxID=2609467 RepID=UPI00260CFE25|nr:acyltransferase [Ferrovum sp.]